MNLFKYANTKYNPIKTIFVYLVMSETQCIICRPDLTEQWNRPTEKLTAQLTDQYKKV